MTDFVWFLDGYQDIKPTGRTKFCLEFGQTIEGDGVTDEAMKPWQSNVCRQCIAFFSVEIFSPGNLCMGVYLRFKSLVSVKLKLLKKK